MTAHEDRYWNATAVGLSTSAVLRKRVVALATLAGAEEEAEAADLLCFVPDLADASAERLFHRSRGRGPFAVYAPRDCLAVRAAGAVAGLPVTILPVADLELARHVAAPEVGSADAPTSGWRQNVGAFRALEPGCPIAAG